MKASSKICTILARLYANNKLINYFIREREDTFFTRLIPMIHSNLAFNHTDIRFSTILQENKNKKKKRKRKILKKNTIANRTSTTIAVTIL